jgi:hypothetical protein
MPLRRVYCRHIRKPPLTIERRREQLPKAAGRSHDRAPSAHLRVLFPRCRSLPRRRGPKPYRSPARRFAATVAMLANRAGYRPALHPDPEASPRVGIVHWAGLIAPSRVVINAVGRVGDHKARRDLYCKTLSSTSSSALKPPMYLIRRMRLRSSTPIAPNGIGSPSKSLGREMQLVAGAIGYVKWKTMASYEGTSALFRRRLPVWCVAHGIPANAKSRKAGADDRLVPSEL